MHGLAAMIDAFGISRATIRGQKPAPLNSILNRRTK